ncbi:MAG: hypothetical protein KJI71_03685 [Patescibacteria group bacterium]|nr:hypothetical protein [Patescibacteria group bacterium]
MEEIITKEIAQKLMKLRGKARGNNFLNDLKFIVKREGEEGIKKVEEELERLGISTKYIEIKATKWYPVGLRAITLLTIKKALGWSNEDIRELGRFAVMGAPLALRIYMKFFHSADKTAKMAPKMWREYFTRGSFEVIEYNEKEKTATLRIKDFDLHPVFCRTTEGYLETFTKLIFKSGELSARETKCTFEGGESHEFLVKPKQ